MPFVLNNFLQYIIPVSLHFFLGMHFKNIYSVTGNFSLLWVSHTDTQTDTYFYLQSRRAKHNEHEDCCYQKE